MASKVATLSDGTTIRVRVTRTIAGTVFTEMPSRKRTGAELMRIGSHMFFVLRGDLVPISHPDYSHASDDKAGADVALRFFVESAEACISHAESEGIPVEAFYGA